MAPGINPEAPTAAGRMPEAAGDFSDAFVVSSVVIWVRGSMPMSVSCLWNRPEERAGDFFEGTVLLLVNPPVGVEATAGLPGVVVPVSFRERRDEVDLLRRILPSLRTLSAPALAFELLLPKPDFLFGFGVVGPLTGGVPCSTSCFVFSSAAVPCIPIKK